MPAKGSGAGRRKGGPQLVIRLSDAERDELRYRAGVAGLTVSEYVRRASLAQWIAPNGSRVDAPRTDGVTY